MKIRNLSTHGRVMKQVNCNRNPLLGTLNNPSNSISLGSRFRWWLGWFVRRRIICWIRSDFWQQWRFSPIHWEFFFWCTCKRLLKFLTSRDGFSWLVNCFTFILQEIYLEANPIATGYDSLATSPSTDSEPVSAGQLLDSVKTVPQVAWNCLKCKAPTAAPMKFCVSCYKVKDKTVFFPLSTYVA